jgi:hypothetical protein
MRMPRYDIDVQLSGKDGNAFSIMGRVINALKKAGASDDEIKEYKSESMNGDYNNLLQVAHKWVNAL